jgi:hypothetical protein
MFSITCKDFGYPPYPPLSRKSLILLALLSVVGEGSH